MFPGGVEASTKLANVLHLESSQHEGNLVVAELALAVAGEALGSLAYKIGAITYGGLFRGGSEGPQ
jgi:hypothetical protein